MTVHKSLRVISFLFLLASLSLVANAQRYRQDNDRYRQGHERWEYLGQASVDGRMDHDSIRVNTRGGFRAIQLQVQGGAIEFQRVVVHFENGADTDVAIRDRIPAGGRTRTIDLPGDRRRIQSVEVWYGKENWRRHPSLRVYGLR